jgi:hypothetical protein
MKIQITYDFDSVHGYPFRATAKVGARTIAIGVSPKSFVHAKARLMSRFEFMRPDSTPPAETVDVDDIVLPPQKTSQKSNGYKRELRPQKPQRLQNW